MPTRFLKIPSNANKILKSKLITAPSYMTIFNFSFPFSIGDSELHVYHTLNVDNPDIRTGTVIVFNAKPTCIRQTSCDACMNLRSTSEFGCSYCPAVHRQVLLK